MPFTSPAAGARGVEREEAGLLIERGMSADAAVLVVLQDRRAARLLL